MADAVSTTALSLPAGNRKLKKGLLICGSLLAALLAAVVIIPHFVDLGLFKQTYLPLIEQALGRRVDVGEVHLKLIPTPSIQLSKLRVSDSQSFADNPFFAAQQVQLKLRLLPLLRGRFEVTELVLDKPVFNLLKQADGSFNYSDIATKKASPIPRREPRKKPEGGGKSSEATPLALPSRMRIRDGQLNIVTKGQTAVKIKGIELALQEMSGDAPFPFRASFQYPGLKSVALEGQLDYQEEKALLEFKNNRLKIQDLTLPVQGSISNLAATPKVNLSLNSNEVDAKPVFQILSVFGLAPGDTEISGPMALNLSVAGPSNALVTQVHGVFKDVYVKGKRALKGNLTGEVSIRLPLGGGRVSQRLQGSGKLVARDGELTNVNLLKKVQRVTGMIGLTPDQQREATTFKTMEGDFTIGGGVADFSRLYLVNPQMEITGNGTMTIDQPTLDMQLNTALSSQAAARTGRGRSATFLKDGQGRIVVPLKVTGPVENPSVNLNVEKLAESGLPKTMEKGFTSFFKNLFRNR
jgi:uncharacterized protein involved in outer membrane biogenesis